MEFQQTLTGHSLEGHGSTENLTNFWPFLNKKERLKEKRKAAREAKTRPHAHKAPDLKEKERFILFCLRKRQQFLTDWNVDLARLHIASITNGTPLLQAQMHILFN
jgi:hypothetical protein